jgi:hypothetical protein
MITNPNPITIEPTPAKVFDKLHVYTLTAIQPTVDSGSISVELLPATSDGEIANGSFVQKVTAPLNPEILDAVPELKEAFEAVLAAIPAVQTYLNNKKEETTNE